MEAIQILVSIFGIECLDTGILMPSKLGLKIAIHTGIQITDCGLREICEVCVKSKMS